MYLGTWSYTWSYNKEYIGIDNDNVFTYILQYTVLNKILTTIKLNNSGINYIWLN